MKFETSFDETTKIVMIKVVGDYHLIKDFQEVGDEVLEVLNRYKAQKILIDQRESCNEGTQFENSNLINELLTIETKEEVKLALIHKDDPDQAEIHRFIENSMRDAGFKFKATTSLDEGRNWLINN